MGAWKGKREGDVLPSGNSGLMLGEMRGRRAGLAVVDVVLFLFFPVRIVGFVSGRLPVGTVPLRGEARAPRAGLGKTEAVAVVGVLVRGLRVERVGVAWRSALATVVSMFGRFGFREELGSRRGMSSMICSISASAREVASARVWLVEEEEGLAVGFWMRIREAGVAGAFLVVVVVVVDGGAGGVFFLCAARWGDFPTEPGRGVAGGGMRISLSASGDMDPVSELSWL